MTKSGTNPLNSIPLVLDLASTRHRGWTFIEDDEGWDFPPFTLYAPHSPENDSGQWEVWLTTGDMGSRWEPPSCDSDCVASFDTGYQAASYIARALFEQELQCAEENISDCYSTWIYEQDFLGEPKMKNETSRYADGGLEERFVIARRDGKPIDPSRRYSLVLDFSGADPHARVAARAYAASVRGENPKLAEDIHAALDNPYAAPRQYDHPHD